MKKAKTKMHKTADPTWHTMTYGCGKKPFDMDYIVHYNEMLGMKLFTHQTGPEGKEVKRLYVEESFNIEKEFYLSCLIDRASAKIVFISRGFA